MRAAPLKTLSQFDRSRTPALTRALTILIFVCLSMQAASSFAQSGDHRSNARMLQVLTRVDELYERGDFERAFLIYHDELASIGDKYAQYMVGYMILSGQGVTQDPILASAWYRLAAERGTDEFEQVRDELLADFDEVQMQHSDRVYRSLCERYCDVAVLLSVIREDLAELGQSTGSRLGAGGMPGVIIDGRTGRQMSGDEYCGRIRQRLETRLGALAKLTGAEHLATQPDAADLDEIERVVDAYLRERP